MSSACTSAPSWPEEPACKAFSTRTTREGMRVALYSFPLEQIPADFFADPDGAWTFESLAKAAGFSPGQGVAIGALKKSFNGHPDGAAVVTLNSETRPHVAVIECPIGFTLAAESRFEESTAA